MKKSKAVPVRSCGYPAAEPKIESGCLSWSCTFYTIDHRGELGDFPQETWEELNADWLGGRRSKTSRERNVYFWRRCHKQKKSLKTGIEHYVKKHLTAAAL